MADSFQFINIAIGYLGLAVASYTDVRNRTVPNLLIIALLALAIGYHIIQGSVPLMAYGFITSLTAGLLLYVLGAIASGDIKLLVAIGMLIPALPWLAFPPFPLLLIWVTLGIAATYVMTLSLQRRNIFRETKKVEELAEGDVPVRQFIVKGGKVEEFLPSTPMHWLHSPFSSFNNTRNMYERMADADCVVGWSADGLSKEEILKLISLAVQGKIPRELELRRTIALVPAFLAAFILFVGLSYLLYGLPI